MNLNKTPEVTQKPVTSEIAACNVRQMKNEVADWSSSGRTARMLAGRKFWRAQAEQTKTLK
jgi:hypothetical protein